MTYFSKKKNDVVSYCLTKKNILLLRMIFYTIDPCDNSSVKNPQSPNKVNGNVISVMQAILWANLSK